MFKATGKAVWKYAKNFGKIKDTIKWEGYRMLTYDLMHKNISCGILQLDEESGRIISYKDRNTGYSPFFGNADIKKIRKWWEMRVAPASRTMIQEILEKSNYLNTEIYLAKNLALSMTDSYWLRPEGTELNYNNVKFCEFEKSPYHNVSPYDPNASLGGQMEKYWEFDEGRPVLVKESSKYFGQQSVNEVFATMIHRLQNNGIPYVSYRATTTDVNSILCKCDAFTSENIEFISAYEVLESRKSNNSQALYDQYINTCVENGIDRNEMQKFMDYQTSIDFIISNTDEHLQNFGILRDANSFELLGAAPIFDSGNSMFYSEHKGNPYTRIELLERPITSFYKNEERMLAKVKDRSIVKEDLLPSPAEVIDFYKQAGIPEEKAKWIGANYQTKLQIFKEFQQGKTISLYHERKTSKQPKKQAIQFKSNGFIMISGLPGSGKTRQAKLLLENLCKNGKKFVVSDTFYPIQSALTETGFILDKQRVLDNLQPLPGNKDTVTFISPNTIREELKEHGIKPYKDLVFLIIEARTKRALMSGATVIYEATNLEKADRMRFMDIVNNIGISDRKLYLMEASAKESAQDIPSERLKLMEETQKNNMPSSEEGWTSIEKCSAIEHYISGEELDR